MGAYDSAVLALSPQSYWKFDEASGSFADSVGSQTLTVHGSPLYSQTITGKTGVGPAVDFSPGWNGSSGQTWALKATAISQVTLNTFSVAGWFAYNGTPQIFNDPLFCASYSGGHVTPFYIVALMPNSSLQWRIVIDVAGGTTFTPLDTGVAMFALDGTWHHVALTYDGTHTCLWIDFLRLVNTTAYSGSLTNTMGSWGINTIPALNDTSHSGPAKAGSVAWWNNYALTTTDVAALQAASVAAVASADPTLLMLQPIVHGRFA